MLIKSIVQLYSVAVKRSSYKMWDVAESSSVKLKKLKSKNISDGQIVLAVITAPAFPSLKASRKRGYFVRTFSHLEGEERERERDKTQSTAERTNLQITSNLQLCQAGF